MTCKRHLAAALLALLAGAGCDRRPREPALSSPRVTGSSGHSGPSFIIVLTDDQDLASVAWMPNVRRRLVDSGMTFGNAFVSFGLCCPSRASLLTGLYPHNHTVMSNRAPDGGWHRFFAAGMENVTVARQLANAGYRTALVGKYLNGFGEAEYVSYVPPGWSHWVAIGDRDPGFYYGYKVFTRGVPRRAGYAAEDYETDFIARTAYETLRNAGRGHHPVFLYLAPFAPHAPAEGAPRHRGMFAGAELPRPPSFNEEDVSDKPRRIRRLPQLTPGQIAQIQEAYRGRIESLQAVDELVAGLLDTLAAYGMLDETYIVFTSDNGYHMGQHRLSPGKGTGYEPDIRVPMVVRGPGIPRGATATDLVLLQDLAPTIVELAGLRLHARFQPDGRSLAPLLLHGRALGRRAFLIEQHFGRRAIRTERWFFGESFSEEAELYDLWHDPDQLVNIAAANPLLVAQLAALRELLLTCVGAGCRLAEDRGLP